MKRFASVALIPLFAGYLFAQAEQTTRTETTTTTTNWNGTLVDAGCYTTHTAHRETTESEPGKTTTTKSSSETMNCPVTTTTTNFGLLTPSGQFVRFDDSSNTRVIEVVKSKKWDKLMNEHKPVRVHIAGTKNGDVVVVKTIQ